MSFDLDDSRLAAIAWSRLIEPGDEVAGTLISNLGVSEALRWLYDFKPEPPPPGPPTAASRLAASASNWQMRLSSLDPNADQASARRVGARLLTPADDQWPAAFADLGIAAPLVLWVRGDLDLAAAGTRSASLVGARAATGYGEQVASQMAAELAERGFTIISGGAYGIDAAAHRGSLAAGAGTVAYLACGIDRFYPLGNTEMLREVTRRGAVVSELPPGAAPYRNRFLARNRLIAAAGSAKVVVEAAWRSGALSTARHAATLLRPVGAVPGPVTSMASAGCHQLIRDGIAVLVTDGAEVAELAGKLGPDTKQPTLFEGRPADGLTPEQRQVLDALPVKRFAEISTLVVSAGLAFSAVVSSLGILESRGLAATNGQGWRRAG